MFQIYPLIREICDALSSMTSLPANFEAKTKMNEWLVSYGYMNDTASSVHLTGHVLTRNFEPLENRNPEEAKFVICYVIGWQPMYSYRILLRWSGNGSFHCENVWRYYHSFLLIFSEKGFCINLVWYLGWNWLTCKESTVRVYRN